MRQASLSRPARRFPRGWGVVMVVALAGCLPVACSKKDPPPAPPPPPVPVTVTTVEKKTAPLEYRTFGTVQAKLTASIKSQVTGLLDIHFKEGDDVKEGQTLFTIDPKPLEAALAQADANLARDTAQHKNAVKEAEREAELQKKGVVAPDVYDTARTNADALAAVIKADLAAIDNARVQLSYCTIKSPIDGRMGQWLVDQGNLVKAQDVTLAVVNQIKPIEVAFAVPQRLLRTIQEEMPKHKLKVRSVIKGQEDRPIVGELAFVDNTVDPSTSMIMLKATFANADERLWPGIYVDVVLTLKEEPGAIIVPTRTIQTGQTGQYVFIVKGDKSVEMRPVTVERTLDGDSVVSKGLDAGETVVTDGQLRLANGLKVVVKPAPGAAKTPAEDEEEDEPDTKASGGKDSYSGPSPGKGPKEKASAEKSEGGRP